MAIHLTCPGCGAAGRLPESAAGKTAKCPKCGARLTVPTTGPESDFEFDPGAEPAVRTFNPFDPTTADVTDEKPSSKRKYGAEQFNPFGAVPESNDAPPVDDPFDYADDGSVPTPQSTFDFGPADAFADEHTVKKKGRKRQ